MIDHTAFFDSARANLFHGKLTQSQVDGMNAILDEWEARPEYTDLRWLAYMLGTAYHETAYKMQPIEEYGKGHGRRYGKPDPITGKVYYGRGYVQLTWKTNYDKMGRVVKADLVNKPELALDPTIAAEIMFYGMKKGSFTGVGLGKYFNDSKTDWINARKIINGLDKADKIAEEAQKFYTALGK